MRLPFAFKLVSLSLITTSTTVVGLPVPKEADIASGVPSSSSLRVTSPDNSRRRTPDSSVTDSVGFAEASTSTPDSSKSAEGINSIIFPTSELDSEQDTLSTKDSSANEDEDSGRQPGFFGFFRRKRCITCEGSNCSFCRKKKRAMSFGRRLSIASNVLNLR
ncbi:hypothetical protein K435DRAFT_974388 [Dendrothele bispora CBS 962.96]|uniref:Uncharacterized protein n=1 Tax=Dendrothele bispora (strain CBS 962.96) TaxID=1314807 RepID=A0A4S8KMU4_DENBC|nr:hypothetical protein K435DRAFT_974388 [Dendrothele bispora CBS 962.96]